MSAWVTQELRCTPLWATAMLIGACASGPPVLVDGNAKERPGWAQTTPPPSGGLTYFTGRARGHAHPDAAAQTALSDALAQVSRQAGAQVTTAIKLKQSARETGRSATVELHLPPTPWTPAIGGKIGGGYSASQSDFNFEMQSSVTGQSVTVKGARALARHDETWQRDGATQYDSWVLLGLPDGELQRLLRKHQDKTALVIVCEAGEASGTCAKAAAGPLIAAAREGGVSLVEGDAPDAAQVMKVTIQVEHVGDIAGDHFAYWTAGFVLLDKETGNTLAARNLEKHKVGHVSQAKVIGRAIGDAVKALAGEVKHGLQ